MFGVSMFLVLGLILVLSLCCYPPLTPFQFRYARTLERSRPDNSPLPAK